MRQFASIAVVIVIVFSFLSPLSMLTPCDDHSSVTIETLDLCHGRTAGVSPDLPCIIPCPAPVLTLELVALVEFTNPILKPSFLAFQDERPPHA